MQMLRELGFLPAISAEAEALARSQEPVSASQQAADMTAGMGQGQEMCDNCIILLWTVTESRASSRLAKRIVTFYLE